MRVIGGEFRSRVLQPVPGMTTRPTPDKLRETLFDILQSEVRGSVFVDAFAGTGAIGIEAVSRGARQAILIEKDKLALATIAANVKTLKIEARTRIIAGAVAAQVGRLEAGIVFLAPPYPKPEEYGLVMGILGEKAPGLVIAQHSYRLALPDEYGGIVKVRMVRQGENVLSFFRPVPEPDIS